MHQLILAAQSNFFHSLFFENEGSLASKRPEVFIDANSTSFLMFLKYLYFAKLDLNNQTLRTTLEIYEFSCRFMVEPLTQSMEMILGAAMSPENVCHMLTFSYSWKLWDLKEKCMAYIDARAEKVFRVQSFLDLDAPFFTAIWERKTLQCSDTKKIEALKMYKNFTPEKKRQLLESIEFKQMSSNEIVDIVKPSKMSNCNYLMENLGIQSEILYAKRIYFSNVAEYEGGANILMGKNPQFLTKIGDKFTSNGSSGTVNNILIDLNDNFYVNHLQLHLGLKKQVFSISFSINKIAWRLMYEQLRNCTLQDIKLYFSDIAVRFIKITGEIKCNGFHISCLPNIVFENDVLIPKFCVSDRQYAYCTPAKFNNILTRYQEKGLQTRFEELRDGQKLVIFFVQPYMMTSCRFRLWNHDTVSQQFSLMATDQYGQSKEIFNGMDEDGWACVQFPKQAVSKFIVTPATGQIRKFRVTFFEAQY